MKKPPPQPSGKPSPAAATPSMRLPVEANQPAPVSAETAPAVREPAGSPTFLLCSCQPGAEAAVRSRAANMIPQARPAAWRRGVVTFRLPESPSSVAAFEPPEKLLSKLVFARTVTYSLGQVTCSHPEGLAAAAVALAGSTGWDNVHLFRREPATRPLGEEVVAVMTSARWAMLAACGLPTDTSEIAKPGDRILDCVIDSAERWWVGWHRAGEPSTRWPGGIYPPSFEPLPEGTVSRAWLKLDEAIAIFGIPFQAGQQVVELGASPGGACQRLLQAGLRVVGVDPAAVDASVASEEQFTQWRMRARELPLRKFVGVDWLVADMNIDPTSTLAEIGRIATSAVRLQGIIATLKTPNWSRAAELPAWLEAFRGWGFDPQARQLSSGGREVCVVAMRVDAPRDRPPAPAGRRRVSRRPARFRRGA